MIIDRDRLRKALSYLGLSNEIDGHGWAFIEVAAAAEAYLEQEDAINLATGVWLKAEPNSDYELLKKQFISLKTLLHTTGKMLSFYREKDWKLSTERLSNLEDSLESERDMNARLTDELAKFTTPKQG